MQVLEQKMANNNCNDSVEVGNKKMNIIDEIHNLLKAADIADKENLEANNNSGESCQRSIYNHTPYPGISQLRDDLYLCGAGVAMPHILDQLGVTFVVNVAPELPDTPLSTITNPLYLRINAMDRPDTDLSIHFDEVCDMIEEVHQHGGKTLIHCVAGVSRSASICIAYLIKHGGMTLRESYQHIKAIRPQIRPNSGFFQQLRAYELQLRGECSVKMIFYESLQKEIPDVYEPEYKAMEEFYQRQRNALKQRVLERQKVIA